MVAKMNNTVAPTSQVQFFHAQLQVKGASSTARPGQPGHAAPTDLLPGSAGDQERPHRRRLPDATCRDVMLRASGTIARAGGTARSAMTPVRMAGRPHPVRGGVGRGRAEQSAGGGRCSITICASSRTTTWVSSLLRRAEEYREAFKGVHDPVILYNIAQSYRLGGNTEQALFFYRSFLRNVPNDPSRPEVEERIRKLEQQLIEQHTMVPAPPAERQAGAGKARLQPSAACETAPAEPHPDR